MEKNELVIILQKIKDTDASLVGTKALNLALMHNIGIPVPSGFCVSCAAYQNYINASIIKHKTDLVKLKHVSLNERKNILAAIRDSIMQTKFSDTLIEQIGNHYHRLSANVVAVRSSGTAEDLLNHSFAGQYGTYLDINDLPMCINAIKKCWASIWTEHAYEYRQKNGFDHFAVNMAVIVQKLINADVSGVLFTVDPVNGYKSRIIIEATLGLGDTLVSGKAKPQRLVLDKKTLRVLSYTTSDGKINELLSELLGDESVVKKLAKLAIKAEIKFGCPQDIEWTVRGNRIWFLQARPITTLPW